MLNNLGDIFEYAMDILLQGEISEIGEIIEYLEEAQQLISERVPIEAPIYTFTLTTNQITLPVEFSSFKKLKVDDIEIEPDECWNGTLYLPKAYESGSWDAKLYYYKKPTQLNPSTLTQVPDIDQRYFTFMAKFAAEMYYLADDDSEMVQAFKSSFFENMVMYRNSKNTVTKFKNIM